MPINTLIFKWLLHRHQSIVYFIFLMAAAHFSHAAQLPLIKIGTGDPKLVFYQQGKLLCQHIFSVKAIPCKTIPSSGSVQNILDLEKHKITIALSQSDILWLALQGKGPFEKIGPNSSLKVSYHLTPLQFVLLVRKKSSIFSFEAIKHHRVNFGIEGSGLRTTMELITEQLGLTKTDFTNITSLPAPKQAKELCRGHLDAIIYIVTAKSRTISQALKTCSMRLVGFSKKNREQLIKLPLGYQPSIIKAGTYPGQNQDIHTISMELLGVVESDRYF